MTRSVALVSLALVVSTIGARQPSEPFLVQPPFALHSAFWPNLHQALWAESGRLAPPLGGNLSSEERRAWDAAVASSKEVVADLHPLFELGPIRKVMISATSELPAEGLKPAHRDALTKAAAV